MITPKDILQINATVLAGLLILLTIISIEAEPTTLTTLESQIKELAITIEQKVTELTIEIQEKEQLLSNKKSELKNLQKDLSEIPTDEILIQEWDKVKTEKKNLILEIQKTAPTPERMANMTKLDKKEGEIFYQLQKGEEGRRFPVIEEIKIVNSTVSALNDAVINLNQIRNDFISRSSLELEEIRVTLKEAIQKDSTNQETSLFDKPEGWVYLIGTPFGFSAFLAIIVSIFDMERIYQNIHLKRVFLLSVGSMGVGFIFLIGIFLKIGKII